MALGAIMVQGSTNAKNEVWYLISTCEFFNIKISTHQREIYKNAFTDMRNAKNIKRTLSAS